ncbi:alpha/beta fold hydrolase [Burkholderia alba]|uniref:alpha/beta fold hydrolase n=1 Tax=Burkholderia alba TaxID=2683677 RepID=UPI002B051F00|nr:alpha/beta hydrolase [Burkholderia alba]
MTALYRRVGTGPHSVLVLHGWFGDAHAFEPMEAALSQDRFSYVFMNYRGYGARRGVGGAFTIDEIAADALALADALDWPRFSLIGHSMGGLAIERVAALAPARVRALVAITPVPCGGVAFDAPTRAMFEAAAGQRALREAIIDRSTGGRLPRAWLERMAAYSWTHSDPRAFAAYFHAWADTDFSAELDRRQRVKVLIGEHDPVMTPALMRATYLTRYAEASVEVIANAGHYPMDETPLALAAAIESFLGADAPAQPA